MEEADMLARNEAFKEIRGPVNRLLELVDHEFNDTDWTWNEFLNDWEKNFTIDVTEQARNSRSWLPTDKQQAHIRRVVAQLELRIGEIREFYM
jgi:hypothetical protein